MRPLAILLLLLAGCRPAPNMQMYDQANNADSVLIQDNQRVKVTRIGVFKDNLAYDGRRGVYLIKDEQTGHEFIGLSGVGISQIGDHPVSAGKTLATHSDER